MHDYKARARYLAVVLAMYGSVAKLITIELSPLSITMKTSGVLNVDGWSPTRHTHSNERRFVFSSRPSSVTSDKNSVLRLECGPSQAERQLYLEKKSISFIGGSQ